MKKASKRSVVKKDGSAAETARLRKALRALKAKHGKALDALKAERDEALEQKTATTDILRVIASTPGDPRQALDTIAETAARMFDAASVGIRRVEGNILRSISAAGPASKAQRSHLPDVPLDGGGNVEICVSENRQIHVEDIAASVASSQSSGGRLSQSMGTRTNAFTPLTRDGRAIGAMVVSRNEVRPFRPDELELMRGFADQAVIAIENARLLQELRTRTEELTESLEQQIATSEVLGVISSSPGELEPVFNTILDNAIRLCDADTANLYRLEDSKLHLSALRGAQPQFEAFLRQRGPQPLHSGGNFARAMQRREPLLLADLTETTEYTARVPGVVAAVEIGGIRSSLSVPLLSGDVTWGFISIHRRHVRPFSDKQIELVENFAKQAVIAIENARLLTELRAALDRQTAMSEVLGVISASPGELKPVFAAMLANALRLCEGQSGVLLRYDGDAFETAAVQGIHPDFAAVWLKDRFRMAPETNMGRMLTTRAVVQDLDLAASPGYLARLPMPVAGVEIGGVRTSVHVPLLKEGAVVGAFIVLRTEVRVFSKKQIELLENFAAQAVIAIENARLLSELRESLDRQTATSEVLGVISASPGELQPVFDAMLANAVRLCESQTGILLRYDGDAFYSVASLGIPPEFETFWQGTRLQMPPESNMGRMLTTKKLVHDLDLATSAGYLARHHAAVAGVELGGIRSVLSVPMLKDEAVVGAFILWRTEVRAYSDKQIALLENFAAQAVIAIENARLLTELKESLENQTASAEVLRTIASSPAEVGRALETICAIAARLFDASSVAIRQLEGGTLRYAASVGERVAQISAVVPLRAIDDTTLSGTAILEQRQVTVDDFTAPAARQRWPATAAVNHFGSMAATPLLREGKAIGTLLTLRDEPRPFSGTELSQLQNFAAQAVIAIENARLLMELRESLDRQTATSDILRVIASTPGDPKCALDTIAETAARMFDASSVGIRRVEGDVLRSVCAAGPASSMIRDALPEVPLDRANFPGECVIDDRQIYIEDMGASSPSLDHLAGRPLPVVQRTVAFTPLSREGEAIGVMVVIRAELRPFTPQELDLMQGFAAQAVIAIENARLLTELRESLDRQTATSEVLGVISSSPADLKPVFETMLGSAVGICGAKIGAMFRRFEDDTWELSASLGMPLAWTEELSGRHKSGPQSVVSRVAELRHPLHILDLRTEAESYLSQHRWAVAALEHGVRTVLGVPMLREDGLLGAIILYRQQVQPFDDKQIDLVTNFADQAVIAIENARLLTELRDRTTELTHALEQQTATSEVLGVISSSPGAVEPVFDTILQNAMRLCEADMGHVFELDGEVLHPAALRGASPEFETFLRQAPTIPIQPNSPVARAIQLKAPVLTADLRESAAYTHSQELGAVRALVDRGGARTGLVVPMLRDDAVVGLIVIYRREVRPFTQKHIDLVANFAKQAVIAIENARLLTELRESLDRQTATSEVLSVISSSPGELEPVFDAMLGNATRLCGASYGALFRYNGDEFHAAAIQCATEVHAELLRRGPRRAKPESGLGRVVATHKSIHIPDLWLDDGYQSLAQPEANPEANPILVGGVRSLLSVPMLKDNELIGVISIYQFELRPFTEKQVALLENFAAQAVIAIENARLLTELRESLDQQTAMAEVLGVISSSSGALEPVFNTILENATRLCDADTGNCYRLEADGLHLESIRGALPEYEAIARNQQGWVPDRQTVHGRALSQKQTIHVADLRDSPGYRARESQAVSAVELGKIRTLLCVPMLRDGEPVGIITIYRREVRPFAEKEIALLENFAAQAVIAIENARLLSELRDSLERQTATANILRVIASTPGDPTRALDTIADTAVRMFDAPNVHIRRIDGDVLRIVSAAGSESASTRTKMPDVPLDPSYGSGRCIAENRQIHHEDTDLVSTDSAIGLLARQLGVRTQAFTPLTQEGRPIGVLIVNRMEHRPFRPDELELMRGFADQAVIAIENARLLTELRERTDELAQRQSELRVTFDNMGDGVAMFDSAQRLLSWNRNLQQILDIPDAFFAQPHTFRDYITYLIERGEFGAVDLEAELKRYADIGTVGRRLERTRPDGRVLEIRNNPVPGGGFVTIYSDVTERRRAEDQIRVARDAAEHALSELKAAQANLIQAEKMASLGQLTAGIAHEIKNPLNFVNNFAGLSVELLGELKEAAQEALAVLGEDKRAEVNEVVEMLTSNLEKIAEHGRRADGIVKSMLAHSRGGSGERQSVNINALVEESLNLAYHGARAQDQNFNITLERDFDSSIAPLEVVPQDITRVFLNLFGNGFYAANKRRIRANDPAFRPVLKVTIRDQGADVAIRIRDNGIGIAPEIRDKLFEPFFTTKPTGEGTGLGLSISYEIVTQQHGGTIEVDSEVGAYTEFTVRLPRRFGTTAASNVSAAGVRP